MTRTRSLVALLCVLCVVSSVTVVAQPPPSRARGYWLSLAAGGFVVPEGQRAVDLLLEMNTLLTSPDPVLRDEVAYAAAERWILRDKRLSPADLRRLIEQWTGNLDVGLGESGTDRVFGRTFSALCLSLVAAFDLTSSFMTPVEAQALFDRTLDYFQRERDLRGYDPKRGWMHSVAHTSDVLKFLARNPKLPRGTDTRLLAAVAAKIDSAETVFTWGENERLALALHAAVRRPDADGAALEAWTKRWVEAHQGLWAGGPRIEPRQFARVENAKQVMRSLYTALSLDAAPSPAGASAAKAVLARLGQMR